MCQTSLNKFEVWQQNELTILRDTVIVTILRLKFAASYGTRTTLMAKGHEEKPMLSIRSYFAPTTASRPGSRPSDWRCTCVLGFVELMKNPGQLGLRRPE
jgi:hypothetical protein